MSYCSTGPNLVLGGYPVSPTTKSTNLPIGIGQVSTIVEPLDEDHEDEVAEDEDQEDETWQELQHDLVVVTVRHLKQKNYFHRSK